MQGLTSGLEMRAPSELRAGQILHFTLKSPLAISLVGRVLDLAKTELMYLTVKWSVPRI